MKKALIYILTVIMLITCSGCVSKEDRVANKVEYLSDLHVQVENEEGCYILFFALKDKNRDYVVSPANIELEIVNDEGESVYRNTYSITVDDYSYWTSPAKGEEYLAPVYIYFDDIKPGETGKGTLTFSVWYGDSFYFYNISENIHSLPEKQETHIGQTEVPPNASSDAQAGLASLVGEWRYMGSYINGPEITISRSGNTYYADIFCMFASGAICILEECPLTYDVAKSGYIAPYEDIAQGNTGQIFISNIDGVYYLTITVESRQFPNNQALTVINQPIEKINQSEVVLTTNGQNSISQEAINRFLSNFCEQYFGDFYDSNYNDAQLIDFTWTWTQLNRPEDMTYSEGYQCLPATNVADIISRYFGLNVTHQSTDWITYSNKQYSAGASNPPTETEIAIVDSVNNNGDDTYTVDFTRYSCNGSPENIFYSYDSYTAKNSQSLQHSGTGRAVIKPNGKSGFTLIEYKTYF